MSITAGRPETAELGVMPEMAFRLPLQSPIEELHASVHVTRGAIRAYDLLPLVPALIEKDGKLEELEPTPDTERRPIVDVIVAEPATAREVASQLQPDHKFYPYQGLLSRTRVGHVISLVTFETSVDDSPDVQRLALEKFIPIDERAGLDKTIKGAGGFATVMAAALQFATRAAVLEGLTEHQALTNAGENTVKNDRAKAIGKAVRYSFFDLITVPELADGRRLFFTGDE